MSESPSPQQQSTRADLAAMIAPIGRALVAAELPILRAHGLTMWGYVVLLALDEQPLRSQTVLAQSIGADKTRIIGVLDGLQQSGLIRRQPDPADRRTHVLALTMEGRLVRESAQAGIQQREERLLDQLTPANRRGFLRALQLLSALPLEEILAGDPDEAS